MKKIEIILEKCNSCCPHYEEYNPDNDPYPDVGWSWKKRFCKRHGNGKLIATVNFDDRTKNGFPTWCPLEDL